MYFVANSNPVCTTRSTAYGEALLFTSYVTSGPCMRWRPMAGLFDFQNCPWIGRKSRLFVA